MKLGRYRFAPPWWGVLVFILVAGLLCALGVWQIERGQMKERMVAEQKAARKNGLQPMRAAHAPSSGNGRTSGLVYGRRYSVDGVADGSRQILLDDQVEGTRVGYRVWLPVRLDSGVWVMVDRGWVPMSPGGRSHPPDPAVPTGRVHMIGFWRSFPQPGIRMGDSKSCDQTGWPRRLSYPDAATVRCQYHAPIANGLLLLSPKDPHGFVRHWDENLVGIPPIQHFVYASQWFLMAFVVGVIFVVVNFKRYP